MTLLDEHSTFNRHYFGLMPATLESPGEAGVCVPRLADAMSFPARAASAVEVCEPKQIICPRCKTPQRRVMVLSGVTVHHCEVKRRKPGSQENVRCDTYLGITVAGRVAIVTALESKYAAEEYVKKIEALLFSNDPELPKAS